MPDATRLPPSLCPHCGYFADAASPSDQNPGAVPKPGDFTLCFRCGEVLHFDDQMRMAALPFGKLEAARLDDPGFVAAMETTSRKIKALASRPGWIPDRGAQA